MAVLGLHFCARAFSSCGKRGPLFIAVCGSLTIAASRCGAQAPDAQAPDAQAQQLWLTGPIAPWHVGSSQTRARTRVPCIGRQILNHCATREALNCCFDRSFFQKVGVNFKVCLLKKLATFHSKDIDTWNVQTAIEFTNILQKLDFRNVHSILFCNKVGSDTPFVTFLPHRG